MIYSNDVFINLFNTQSSETPLMANFALLQKHSNYLTYLLTESNDLSIFNLKVTIVAGTVYFNYSSF